ncbi:MAG: AAA domain-containing protein [Promethearchaeota archaeon]
MMRNNIRAKKPNRNNLYYHCLASDARQVTAIINGAWESFEPIREYLDKSIEAERERSIGCHFEVLYTEKYLYLEKQSIKLEILRTGTLIFKFDIDWYEIINAQEFDEIPENKKLNYTDEEEYYKIDKNNLYIDKDDKKVFIKFPKRPNKDEVIEWNKKEIRYEKVLDDIEYPTIRQGDKYINISNVKFNPDINNFEIQFKGNINKKEKIFVNNFPIKSFQIKYNNEDFEKIVSIESNNDGEVIENTIKPLFYDKENNELIIPKREYKKLIIYDKNGKELLYDFGIDEELKFITVNGKDYEIKQSDIDNYYICLNDFPPRNYSIAIGNDKHQYSYTIEFKKERELRIRLFETDEEKEDISDRSQIDYFFDDDVEDLLGDPKYYKAKKYGMIFKIKRKDYEKRIIVIKTNGKKYRQILSNLEYLARKKKKIYLHRNLYQLKMQKWAIEQLIEKSLLEHRYLMRLSENSDVIRWEHIKFEDNINEDEWKILNDPNYEDIETQREFVRIALNTPDYAFLEGPPGSGKTTTILELIYQLVKRHKKILLTGSTHVAIDNVLERLKENNIMMDKILPIRIGKIDRISKNIEEFQIDNLIPKKSEFKNLILNASNLVCGTMIGILKHPLFNEIFSKINNKKSRVVPIYDYLIIDEASKTTFQEFIIPALFAKKWILIGDIKQLSPYTESSYLKKYLEKIKDNASKPFPNDFQKACYFLYLLLNYFLDFRKIRRNYKIPKDFKFKFICPVKNKILLALIEEIPKRFESLENDDKNKFPIIGIITNTKIKSNEINCFIPIRIDDILESKEKSILMNSCDILFIDSEEFKKNSILKEKVPSNFLVINQSNWEIEQQHYRLKYFITEFKKFNFEFMKKELEIINEDIGKRDWANEISWRLIRLYELRDVKHNKNYEKHLEYLLPKSRNLSNSIDNASSIALPSILELLQIGIQQQFRTNIKSVLKTGFPIKDFSSRHKKLLYQFRMHPDISKFSRKEFYTDTNGKSALKDSNAIDREKEWTYKRYNNKSYKSRAVWINVNGVHKKNSNPKEVNILMRELKKFVNWANSNENPRNVKEPWIVACLTYYRGQERLIRDKLRTFTNQFNRNNYFQKGRVHIILHTVDKIQGQEVDVVFLSMVRTSNRKWGGNFGFMDNPNRLNVALTRAKYQLVIIGQLHNFKNQNSSQILKDLTDIIDIEGRS